MTPTKVLVGQVLVVFAIVIAGLWFATEWAAAQLGFQPQLGAPWFVALDYPVYYPWRLFEWWYAYDAYAPTLFNEAGAIAALGGVAGMRRGDHRLAVARPAEPSTSRPMVRPAGRPTVTSPKPVCSIRPASSSAGLSGTICATTARSMSWPSRRRAPAKASASSSRPAVLDRISVVIHDIKGENWQLTAGWRAQFSHCLLFNPTDPRSARYNPLLEVRKGPDEVRDVQNIADILVDPEGALERRNHWEKTSHSLLVGAILHVLYAEEEKTLARVASFLSDPQRSFEHTLRAHDGDQPSRHDRAARRPSRRRLGRTRGAEQIRERALRRAFHRHVVPRSLSRSDRRGDDLGLRLAHRRSGGCGPAGVALPCHSAVGHFPHQAAGPPGAQPDRPPPDRAAGRRSRQDAASTSC